MPGTIGATCGWGTKAGPVTGPRLAAAGGVVVGCVDLSRPLSPALKDRILAAFHDHHIVVFRDQALTREQQFAFSASFGEVEFHGGQTAAGKRYGVAHVISNLGSDGKPVDRSSSPVSNHRWHTDKAYHAVPPMLTTLYAVDMPAEGGDTEFANTAMSYAALPEETKRRILHRTVVKGTVPF